MDRTVPLDLVGWRKVWFSLSLLAVIPGLFFLVARGLNYGIDFTGGAFYRFQVAGVFPSENDPARTTLTGEIRQALGGNATVQLAANNQINIRAAAKTQEELQRSGKEFGERLTRQLRPRYGEVTSLGETFVGPVVGRELKTKSVWALIFGLGILLFYISIRYSPVFAVAAIIALFHDVLVQVGIFAIGYWQVDTPFIAAVLTVVGYSINDTVVIFDRIRENLGPRRRVGDLAHVVNVSLWQTMSRSINTVLTVIFVLLCLFFLGGESIHTFALALLIGITSGAYSSIFTASPIMVAWEEYKARKERETSVRGRVRAVRQPVAAARDVAAQGASGEDNGGMGEAEEREAVPGGKAAGSPGRSVSPKPSRRRPSQQRKSKRRF